MEDPAAAETLSAINITTTRERFHGNQSQIRLLAETLIGEATGLMQQMREAVVSRDADVIRRCAHSLKGAAAVFDATDVVECALRLETIAQSADFADLETQLENADVKVGRLIEALTLLSKQRDER